MCAPFILFERDVILYGGQTTHNVEKGLIKFERDVILYGGQTTKNLDEMLAPV